MTVPKDDLTGRVFGSWTVLQFSHRAHDRQPFWRCRCICGTEKAVRGSDLTRGESTRCRECGKVAVGPHGRALYKVWNSLRRRCENPKAQHWGHYGGRGITVCERWLSFANFYADMFPTYQPGLSIDRRDVDGPYSPENCRWATRKQQARNKRNNRLLAFRGRAVTAVEWGELVGLNADVIRYRVIKLGWPVERALTTGAHADAVACLTGAAGADHHCAICA
ncbi:hypothetical protein OHV08_33870 [Streptomyces canus]|uniref:hypothetical protein n=1 Tax=Streptomyces canus TaxID=58343 RepID=UPI00325436A6